MSGRGAMGMFLGGLALGMAGCTGAAGWQKAGASSAEAAQAETSCTRDVAVKVYGRESQVRYYRSVELDPSCMRAKGFTPR